MTTYILKILADCRKIDELFDTSSSEHGRVTNSAQLEDRRGVYGTTRHDNLFAYINRVCPSTRGVGHTRCHHVSVYFDRQKVDLGN